jgi:hypothetical protein
MYFAYYLCTVYLPAVSLASLTKEALHPNPRTLSLQCIPMRPLHPTCGRHPQLGCRMGSPFRCSPARCVASSARSSRHSPRPTPAPRLRCSLARPALACATPTLTLTRPTLADARLPSTGGRRWQWGEAWRDNLGGGTWCQEEPAARDGRGRRAASHKEGAAPELEDSLWSGAVEARF